MKLKNQNGFAAVEALLIVVILAIVAGTGFFVWHSKQATENSLNNTASSQPALATKKKAVATSPPTTQTDNTKYIVIKEWGVKAPYAGNLHLNYAISNFGGTPAVYAASFTSTELGTDPGCAAGGGVVERAYADTVLDDAGNTPTKSAAPYTVTKVGGYYYVYRHPQALCSSDTSVNEQTSDAVSNFVKNLQAY